MFEKYGVECGEGWKGLYQPLLDLCELYGVTVEQVKEKFGGLRFYVSGPRNRELWAIIRAAETASVHVCEDCGADSIIGHGEHGPTYAVSVKGINGGYWLKALCDSCRAKREVKK